MPTGEQETPYKDLDYEAILNMDYGYRTEATIAQNAKDIAREHNLDELSVKEELDRINQFQQKDKETREEEIVEQKEQEKNQEVGQVDKKNRRIHTIYTKTSYNRTIRKRNTTMGKNTRDRN